jgi:hypothetical protein
MKKKSAVSNRLEAASTDDEEEPEANQRNPSKWSRRNPGLLGSNIPRYIQPELDEENKEWVEQLKTGSAYDFYKVFQPPMFAEEVVYQSRLYAVQKDRKQALELTNIDTYR